MESFHTELLVMDYHLKRNRRNQKDRIEWNLGRIEREDT